MEMNKTEKMNFIAKTIRENRESKGYSLKELANRTFLSVSTIK